MISNSFNSSAFDICVCFKKVSDECIIYLILYVDDMLMACRSMSEIAKLKNQFVRNSK